MLYKCFFDGRICTAVLPCELQLVQDGTSDSEPESSTSVATVFSAHAEDKPLRLFTTLDLNSCLIINRMGAF